MATIVTALMYSGKQNPTWELSEEQTKKLKEVLKEEKELTFEMSALSVGILGYKGFVIESLNEPTIPLKTFCFDGIIDFADQTQINYIDKGSELESFLLETGSNSLTKLEQSYIESELSKNVKGGTASMNKSFKGTMEIFAVPPYDPGKWNIPSVQRYNNCYNYANDKITNTFAQPGRGSGSTIADVLCNTVSSAAVRDGQISVSAASSTPMEGHFIALVSANIPTFQDYHWYRLDLNTMWSHKPGQTPAKNTDNSGRLISDPRTADRGPYTDFCGFFHCIPSRTTIR